MWNFERPEGYEPSQNWGRKIGTVGISCLSSYGSLIRENSQIRKGVIGKRWGLSSKFCPRSKDLWTSENFLAPPQVRSRPPTAEIRIWKISLSDFIGFPSQRTFRISETYPLVVPR